MLMQASGPFTIFEATDLKAELLAALYKAETTLEIDLSGVEEVDSAGMQLLIMLKREATRTDKRLIYSHHSPSVIALIELMELGEYLGDPMLILNPT
jgi:ABC-type transporter Mla MlaB component